MAQKSIETNKARQGRWGLHALAILIGGLLLAMIGWYVAEALGPDRSADAPAPAVSENAG